MSMLRDFTDFIVSEKLFTDKEKILLTVSGGVDSVVMSALFKQSGYTFGIAHCNFNLRGKESSKDATFVKSLAEKLNAAFHCVSFETEKYAKEKGISIQMAAREMRYRWFEKVRSATEGYDYIATAHQKDDETETILLNMIRGTGIAGLHGIMPKKGKIIRPMLFAAKNEIVEFAKKEKIDFMEDASNNDLKYIRNKIRHKIIPLLKEINPDIYASFSKNAYHIRNVELIYKSQIEKQRKVIVSQKGDKTLISIEKLLRLNPCTPFLFEFLSPFGFKDADLQNIILSLGRNPGKQFFSHDYRLIRDRKELIITPLNKIRKDSNTINCGQERIDKPTKLFLKKISAGNNMVCFSSPPHIVYLDYEKLYFPLKVRLWRKGDFFYPIGMTGKKKLSNYFIDNKIPLNEKENIFVLESDGQIVWIIGYRLDKRFKVEKKTKAIYKIELQNEHCGKTTF